MEWGSSPSALLYLGGLEQSFVSQNVFVCLFATGKSFKMKLFAQFVKMGSHVDISQHAWQAKFSQQNIARFSSKCAFEFPNIDNVPGNNIPDSRTFKMCAFNMKYYTEKLTNANFFTIKTVNIVKEVRHCKCNH